MSAWRLVRLEAWRGVRLEACPQEACPQEGCPPEACLLEGCPQEAEAKISAGGVSPGGLSAWRPVLLEACPTGGLSAGEMTANRGGLAVGGQKRKRRFLVDDDVPSKGKVEEEVREKKV